uniref:Uncharacterized protein n=1 Tax=Monodelphis domestica TaxID=13616 RepID=A0A5F8HHT4_MONDO
MTDRLLEKIEAIDEYSKMMDFRIRRDRMRNISVKKSLCIPLTFDFHTGFEKPCTKIITSKPGESSHKASGDQQKGAKTISGLNVWKPKLLNNGFVPRRCLYGKANIRPYSVPGNLKYYHREKLQHLESPTAWESVKTSLQPKSKDKAEREHLVSVPQGTILFFDGGLGGIKKFSTRDRELEMKIKDFPGKRKHLTQNFMKIPNIIGTSPNEAMKARRKKISIQDAKSWDKSKWSKNLYSVECALEKEEASLIPLSFEDELNKPNAKIIDLNKPKEAVSSPVLSKTNPIIFHEPAYIQMFLLTRDKCHLKKEDEMTTGTRTNLVLKKNNEMIKALISESFTAALCPKKTLLNKWQIDDNMPRRYPQRRNISLLQTSSDERLAPRGSPVSERSSESELTSKSSQFLYSSNARHSKYLQNFYKVQDFRMTQLDHILARNPPQKALTGQAAPGLPSLGSKQSPSLAEYNDKSSGLPQVWKSQTTRTVDPTVVSGVQEEPASTSDKALFLTSLENAQRWPEMRAESQSL